MGPARLCGARHMIPGIAGNPYLGVYTPKHLFRRGADGWILLPRDHSTLWIDEERTEQASLPGDPVWWIGDKSPSQNHFSAVSSAARGRLYRWPASAVLAGSPRNLLKRTEALDSWDVFGGESSVTPGIDDPFGGTNAFRLTGVSNLGRVRVPGQTVITTGTYTMTLYARTISGSGIRFFPNGGVTPFTSEWQRYEVPVVYGGISTEFQFRLRPGPPDIVDVYLPQLQVGSSALPYQRVGNNFWDVSEDGYPDCWGIGHDGVTTQYLSTRGIPLFRDGRIAACVAQTKFNDIGGNGIVLASQTTGSTDNAFALYAPATNQSYVSRYRTTANLQASTSIIYPAQHSAILSSRVESNLPCSITLRVNNDEDILAQGVGGGTLNSLTWSLGAFRGGTLPFNGIVWGSIMVADDPEPDIWEIGARQWLSDNAMGGILAI